VSLTTATEPHWLTMDYMGTSFPEFGDPAFCFDLRLTRCYELSALAILRGDLGDGTLVHGSIHGPEAERRIGHGWVLVATEPGERPQVWEPITGRFYYREEWYAWARAEEERTYDAERAALAMLHHGHWGRWHDSPHP
jgi:hypothetical protein